jgi:hypothetical protein
LLGEAAWGNETLQLPEGAPTSGEIFLQMKVLMEISSWF